MGIWLTVPAVLVLVSVHLADTDVGVLAETAEPLFGVVTKDRAVTSSEAILVLVEDDVRVVVGPGWSGRVTAVFVAPGDNLASGRRVLEIDGISRLFMASETPYWRALGRSSRYRRDVEMLQEDLSDLGYFAGVVDGIFGPSTEGAVRSLSLALGHEEPQSEFSPAWFVWGADAWLPLVVGEFGIEVGDRVSGGESVVATPNFVLSAQLRSIDKPIDLSSDSVHMGRLYGTEFLVSASGSINPDDLPAAATDGDTVAVTSRSRDASHLVPSGSVSVSADGLSLCIWLVVSRLDYAPVHVAVEPSRPGLVQLVSIDENFDIRSGDRLVTNPSAIGLGSCP